MYKTQSYLMDCRFDVKELKRIFLFDPKNRLDHKEQVSALQNYASQHFAKFSAH